LIFLDKPEKQIYGMLFESQPKGYSNVEMK